MYNLRGKRITVCLILALIMLINGCQGKTDTTMGQIDTKGKTVMEEMTYETLEDIDLAWKDNTLDDWHAVINQPLKEIKEDGEQYGGMLKFVTCEGGGIRFKTHLFSVNKKSWSGVNGIRTDGEEFSVTMEVDQDRVGTQIDLLGPVSGKEAYVACKCFLDEENKISGLWFYELNDAFEKTKEVYLELSLASFPEDLAGDQQGNYHMICKEVETDSNIYIIVSSEGEILFEAGGNFHGLREYGEGQIAVCEDVTEGGVGKRLLKADIEKGIISEIGKLNLLTAYAETKMSGMIIYFLTLKNEKEMVWFGSEGAYFCDQKGEGTRMAYRWADHGMEVQDVRDAYAREDGTIAVIYKDKEGMNYLLLTPTVEKTEIKTITFAVNNTNKEEYLKAAAIFNKKYPAYGVIIKDDYDETSLLTQLGAGAGPVLVDTALTGFEDLEKLWQPLDGLIKNSGMADELIPEAMDLGKIGGRTYGIVTGFHIRTLIVTDEDIADWNREEFLSTLERFDGAVYTAEWIHEPSDGRYGFFHLLLRNGLEDNAYFDAEKGSMIFGTSEFERMLTLSEKARSNPPSAGGKALRNNEALCEMVIVSGPEDLIKLRARQESGEFVIGYPTKDGAKFFLIAQSPITIRKTATDEEKKMAYTFLQILLSKDSAEMAVESTTHTGFSVRKDMLNKQFDRYERQVAMTKATGSTEELPELDREKEKNLFEKLLENSVPQKAFPTGLESVFEEEFGDYLDGKIDGKVLEDHMKKRVWLYLEEMK